MKKLSNYFEYLILSNLYKEFNGTYSIEEINKFFLNNLTYLKEKDLERKDVTSLKIKPSREFFNILKQGGIIMTLHYGEYRKIIPSLFNILKKENKKLTILVDKDSYENEPKEYFNQGWDYLNVEEINSGKKILNILKAKQIILVYLDGFTGYGKDKSLLNTNFINSELNIRSGIFRAGEIAKTNCIPFISHKIKGDTLDINFGKVHKLKKIYREENVNSIYNFFEENVSQDFSKLRFWFRYHYQRKRQINVNKLIEPIGYYLELKNKKYIIKSDGGLYEKINC